MKLTGAEIIMECLLEQGVDTVFGYPGGAVLRCISITERSGTSRRRMSRRPHTQRMAMRAQAEKPACASQPPALARRIL